MTIPEEMLPILTDELVDKLMQLKPSQVRGIARIIAAGYVTERPACPRYLLTGDDPICSMTVFYRTGKWNEEKQIWDVSPGWMRQPAFVEALNMAKRLALRFNTDEEFAVVREANRRARLAAAEVMSEMISLAKPKPMLVLDEDEGGEDKPLKVDRKSQVAAATLVLKYANLDAVQVDDTGENPEMDWWEAAEEDE